MRRGLALLALLFGSAVVGACSWPRDPAAYASVDQMQPAPVGRPANPWVRPVDLAKQAAGDTSENPCGPRTGLNEEGKCERLSSEPWGKGERVLLPKGEVLLGGVPGAYFGGPNSKGTPMIRYPHHALVRETIESFWIDVVEVQRVDYQDCVDAGRCTPARCSATDNGVPEQFASEGPEVQAGLPVTCVSYSQAEAFCAFRQGHLPTMAQWVYAARGPLLRPYSWGTAFDDAISMGPLPVRLSRDSSYFGIRGLNGGAREIIAGTPRLDQTLEPWLERSFRAKRGPYLAHLDRWIKRYACPKSKLNAKCRKREAQHRHWVSGSRLDLASLVWSKAPEDPSLTVSPNQGALARIPSADIGFRCAYPKRETDPELKLARGALEPPEQLRGTSINLFVGVAEAVNYSEAQAFCAGVRLVVDKGREDAGPWRLPTQNDLVLVQEHRLGPGPLWLADGTAVKAELKGNGTVKRWETVPADQKKSALLARCVR